MVTGSNPDFCCKLLPHISCKVSDSSASPSDETKIRDPIHYKRAYVEKHTLVEELVLEKKATVHVPSILAVVFYILLFGSLVLGFFFPRGKAIGSSKGKLGQWNRQFSISN